SRSAPFFVENADEGIAELRQYVDSLIVIPNSRILSIIDTATAARAAFDKPNEILYEATRGIADIITIKGIINVDFADVRTVMRDSGQALMGCGIASGENRAIEAAQKAISSPLLEGVSIKGAKNILLNVSGSANMTMQEIEAGNNVIFEAAGEEANVIFGVVNKESMTEYISYTVIATGFETKASSKPISSLKSEKAERKLDLPDRLASSPTSRSGQAGKKVGNIGAAFSTKKGADLENSEDLSIPTILRYNKGDLDLFARNANIESGFRTEHADYPEDDFSQNKKNNEEEDSSSFLRKIMD
ncbi:MAG: cell division protein FtsZ, partial [Bacteroidetes bacterium]|nr:cell division protein FtsZ [Bacteroidota bacterium]